MVHRYADVAAVLTDHERFSLAPSTGKAGSAMAAPTMLNSDPPDHERLRGAVSRAFTPRSIAALEGRIDEVARNCTAPLVRDNDEFDVVTRLAEPLPVLVIAEMLGVGDADLSDFIDWSHGLLGVLDMFGGPTAADRAAHCAKRLHDYFADEVRRRRDAPTDGDLIGRLVAANEDGRLSEDELLASCVLLLLGGNETTTKLITNAVLTLARHPDERARLVADNALLTTAIDELLRYDTPVQGDARVALCDTPIAGVTIPQGSLVVTLLGAANRDPDVFADPDRLDIGRNPNPIMSFGRGIHYCIGASLARLEARAALGALLSVAPGYQVTQPYESRPYDRPTFFFHAPGRLPIRRA
jgi:cytochrome P450